MDGNAQTNSPNGVLVYRRLILDQRISHGAFRLWHYLRDRKNKDGQAWPKVRDIAADLHCKTDSVTGWTKQLVDAGYLAVEKIGQKHYHRYTILYGDEHQFAYPQWATRNKSRVPQTMDTKQVSDRVSIGYPYPKDTVSCTPNSHVVSPKGGTPRVPQKGDLSNTSVVIPISKGTTSSSFEILEDKPASKTKRISIQDLTDAKLADFGKKMRAAVNGTYNENEKT